MKSLSPLPNRRPEPALATGLERASGNHIKVKHLAEVLDESYRRAEAPGRRARRGPRLPFGRVRRFNRFRRDEHDPTARPAAPASWQ